MSCNSLLLIHRISACLQESPRKTLGDLSHSLHVSESTLKKIVRSSTGKSFRCFREQILLGRVRHLLVHQPDLAIKELSFDVGFQSASSFARAIRRASGLSPEELRFQIALELGIAVRRETELELHA